MTRRGERRTFFFQVAKWSVKSFMEVMNMEKFITRRCNVARQSRWKTDRYRRRLPSRIRVLKSAKRGRAWPAKHPGDYSRFESGTLIALFQTRAHFCSDTRRRRALARTPVDARTRGNAREEREDEEARAAPRRRVSLGASPPRDTQAVPNERMVMAFSFSEHRSERSVRFRGRR